MPSTRVRWDDPIEVEIGDFVMYSTPPPGSGVILGFILDILSNYYDLDEVDKEVLYQV